MMPATPSSFLLLPFVFFASQLRHGNAVVESLNVMYVWNNAFDVDAPHCNGIYPMNKNEDNSTCFQHSWETPEARSRLWASCTQVGREVKRILLSDVRQRTRHGGGGFNSDLQCDPALLTTLTEAHSYGIQVYGLFASSDQAFSEQGMVGDLNAFNAECGTTEAYFDGASVNNEYFTSVKTCGDAAKEVEQLQFLDDLQTTANNADPLPLHFSVSWNWDCCSCSSSSYARRELTWNGEVKSALEHMIDTVDSLDVQVAWNTGSTMVARSTNPYNYWEANHMESSNTTAFYVLAYTNPNSDCRLSFSPHTKGAGTATDTCSTGDRTEEGMFTAFDTIKTTHANAQGGIHFMGGVYSTGMVGWPKHEAATPGPTSPPTRNPTQAPTSEPTNPPVPPGVCSDDGVTVCAEGDVSACACGGGRRLLKGSNDAGKKQSLRRLGKKTPSPTPPATPSPTPNPTPFVCQCNLPTPTPPPVPSCDCSSYTEKNPCKNACGGSACSWRQNSYCSAA
mmetsp:Transcript_38251/g.80487  ORF Transcript_38251/g.80487 Transcript_38251/m.80487 type:complete len:507 (+) Transcript_38251:76-1596(+)